MGNKLGSIKNLVWGIFGTLVTTAVAMIIPRLFIVNYGSEINGLLSSIRQIYVYLALLEAGIGSASLQAMYHPIAHDDYSKMNGILSATNYHYKKIGYVYLIAIIVAGITYPMLLDTTIPYEVCVAVIILQGMGSILNYFFLGKYVILLNVDNKAYINNNVVTVSNVFTDIIRVVLLLNGKSIIAIQSTYLFFSILKTIYILCYVKKHYSWIDLTVNPDFDSISQSNSVFVHQISSLIFNNTDVLILTFFCGLQTVSIYAIYASFYSIINNLISILTTSFQSAFGRIYHSNKNKFIKYHGVYESFYITLVFSLFTITTILILPFLKLYTDGADINYLDYKVAFLFCIFQLLNYGRATSSQIITFAGEFSSTKSRAIIESLINLIVSFIAVFKFGIYGVLIGTIVALLYRANDMILFANHRIMNRSAKPTYIKWFRNFVVFFILTISFSNVNLYVTTYFDWFKNAVLVSVVNIVVYYSALIVFESKFREMIKILFDKYFRRN